MDDGQFDHAKLSILHEQIGYYTNLIERLQTHIAVMATTEAEYGNLKASLLAEAETLERRHFRVD